MQKLHSYQMYLRIFYILAASIFRVEIGTPVDTINYMESELEVWVFGWEDGLEEFALHTVQQSLVK